jgi:hypothetical protein
MLTQQRPDSADLQKNSRFKAHFFRQEKLFSLVSLSLLLSERYQGRTYSIRFASDLRFSCWIGLVLQNKSVCQSAL